RTLDGAMHPFQRGVWLLLSRAKCPVLPIAIEGAYDAFRRGTSFPRLTGVRLATRVGPVIPFEKLEAMGPAKGLAYPAATIETMRAELAERLKAEGLTISTIPASNAEQAEPGEPKRPQPTRPPSPGSPPPPSSAAPRWA